MSAEKDSPLKRARLLKKMTLEELADKAQTNPGNLSRIERGKSQCPVDLAERLVAALGEPSHVNEMQILYPNRTYHEPPPADNVQQSGLKVTVGKLTLGPIPPKLIRIEGHLYRLERKA